MYTCLCWRKINGDIFLRIFHSNTDFVLTANCSCNNSLNCCCWNYCKRYCSWSIWHRSKRILGLWGCWKLWKPRIAPVSKALHGVICSFSCFRTGNIPNQIPLLATNNGDLGCRTNQACMPPCCYDNKSPSDGESKVNGSESQLNHTYQTCELLFHFHQNGFIEHLYICVWIEYINST